MKKINTYKSFKIEENQYESPWEEDENDEPEDSEHEEGEYDTEEVDENFDSEMTSLCETIKSLYDNANLSVDVDYDGLNIIIYAFLERREKIRTITKILDISNKLKSDILPQYDSEFELYESEEEYPVMCFEFTLNDGTEDKEAWTDGLDPDSKYSRSGARLF